MRQCPQCYGTTFEDAPRAEDALETSWSCGKCGYQAIERETDDECSECGDIFSLLMDTKGEYLWCLACGIPAEAETPAPVATPTENPGGKVLHLPRQPRKAAPTHTRGQRKELARLAALAHERDLETELEKLEGHFTAWREGRLSAFDLSQEVHAFHQGPARDLHQRYERTDRRLVVADAISRGTLEEAEVGASVRELLPQVLR